MKKVLFVCLGNICRSPTAEGIFLDLVTKKGIRDQFKIDSAGMVSFHTGELPDPRTRAHAKKRGYDLTHRARPFTKNDFEDFDYLVAMDDSHVQKMKALDPSQKYHHKILKMVSYCKDHKVSEVPDPYYEGPEMFEKVLDILEDACDGFLKSLEQ